MPTKVFDARDDVARHNRSQSIPAAKRRAPLAGEPSAKYARMNHHHEMTDAHKMVSIGGVQFVANKKAIPLLEALSDLGLRTRTHHVDDDGGFVSILIDPTVRCEIKQVSERDATRTTYDGQTEVLISWYQPDVHKKGKS